jgi:hypothetical protein
VDLDAVRTFVAAADAGQFQEAAAALSITQQAVSKRIAALEKDLDVRLFTRTPAAPSSPSTARPSCRTPVSCSGCGAGRRLRAPRPARAARRRRQPTDRAGGAAAGLLPHASARSSWTS